MLEIVNYIAQAVPVMIASYDSGYNFFFNPQAAREYLEAFLITKDKM